VTLRRTSICVDLSVGFPLYGFGNLGSEGKGGSSWGIGPSSFRMAIGEP
jgi:hypothetical protein